MIGGSNNNNNNSKTFAGDTSFEIKPYTGSVSPQFSPWLIALMVGAVVVVGAGIYMVVKR